MEKCGLSALSIYQNTKISDITLAFVGSESGSIFALEIPYKIDQTSVKQSMLNVHASTVTGIF